MKEINNNIQESYCSFEVSKLLKKKGFNCYTTTWHQRGNGIVGDVVGKSDRYNSKGEAYTSHPTHALAQKWLREKHNIHVQIDFSYSSPFDVIWYANIYILKTQEVYQAENGKEYGTYEEALEEGLRVGLNLIE